MLTKLSAVIASEAKQSIGTANSVPMDCFVASLLAMTEETPPVRGARSANPESRFNNLEVPDRIAARSVRNDA